jgi:hypothetical protein
MKHNILFAFLFAGISISLSAQEEAPQGAVTTKSGKYILPEQGDIAIGVNGAPFITYFGNLLNGSTNNNSPALSFLNNQEIYFKYFLADDAALRVSVKANTTNSTSKAYVRDDAAYFADPNSQALVSDKYMLSQSDLMLGIGFEKRRGYGRLQGFYGAGIHARFLKTNHEFEYANPHSLLNPAPSTHNFNGNNYGGGMRSLEYSNQNRLGLGAQLFVGIEYFILPKISIGGEFGWALSFYKDMKTTETYEYWNNTRVDQQTRQNTAGGSGFSTYTSNPSGGIYFMFHF